MAMTDGERHKRWLDRLRAKAARADELEARAASDKQTIRDLVAFVNMLSLPSTNTDWPGRAAEYLRRRGLTSVLRTPQ